MCAADIADTSSICRWIDDNYGVDMTKPGAQQWYDSVFALLASWGVDYVKVDDISSPASNTKDEWRGAEIEAIRKAIDKCGRQIVLSLSPGPAPLDKAEVLKANANLWRVSNDVWDKWGDILLQFDFGAQWAGHSGPSHCPDADMLPLGRIGIRAERGDARNSKLTPDEQRAMMTLWCLCRSPLMFGGDLPTSGAATIEMLTNDEVLAVDQHSQNGRQLYRRAEGEEVVWIADIPGSSDKYVAMFNLYSSPMSLKLELKDAGLPSQCSVRDLWERKNLADIQGVLVQQIPAHGAGLYRVSPR